MKFASIFLILIAALSLLMPARSVFGAVISNTVSASANTGGNKSSTQSVSAGLGKANVSIRTIVDGVVVEDIERYKEGTIVELNQKSSHVLGVKNSTVTKTETYSTAEKNVVGRDSEGLSIKVSDVRIIRDMKHSTTTTSTSAPDSAAVIKTDTKTEARIDNDVGSVVNHSALAGIGIFFQSFMEKIKYVFTKFF